MTILLKHSGLPGGGVGGANPAPGIREGCREEARTEFRSMTRSQLGVQGRGGGAACAGDRRDDQCAGPEAPAGLGSEQSWTEEQERDAGPSHLGPAARENGALLRRVPTQLAEVWSWLYLPGGVDSGFEDLGWQR